MSRVKVFFHLIVENGCLRVQNPLGGGAKIHFEQFFIQDGVQEDCQAILGNNEMALTHLKMDLE